jgi:hypothetical protein
MYYNHKSNFRRLFLLWVKEYSMNLFNGGESYFNNTYSSPTYLLLKLTQPTMKSEMMKSKMLC